MFSQTVEYILRVAVFLAAKGKNPSTTYQISSATLVPIGYLAKIMQRLVKSGLVKSQRGRNGGFLLAPEAFNLTLLDIVQQLEPIARIEVCPLGLPQHGKGSLCALHTRLDKAIKSVEQTLAESSISTLVANLGDCAGMSSVHGAAAGAAGVTVA